MSYKHQEIEWSVPLSEVQIGIPIGYEVQFSQKPSFYPVLFTLSTYKEVSASAQGTFYYSLDNGVTWIDYPIGEVGQTFYSSYKMKLVINSAETSYIFAEKNGTIYRITPDGSRILETYTIDDFTSSAFENYDRNNTLYTSGQNNTLYKVETYQGFEAGDNSVNIHSNPLGIAIDSTRGSFWQIDRNKVTLKELDGNEIFHVDLPFDIDVDYSSSSSNSSSSYSSESSSSNSSSSYSSSSELISSISSASISTEFMTSSSSSTSQSSQSISSHSSQWYSESSYSSSSYSFSSTSSSSDSSSSPSSSSKSTESSSSSGGLLYVSGVINPDYTGEYKYIGQLLVNDGFSGHISSIYQRPVIIGNGYMWYSDVTLGYESSRWIISYGVVSDSMFFPNSGLDYHWYSNVAGSSTVYIGNYNPASGATGTAVVSQT